MGIALWMLCAAAVFFTIRNIRFGRPPGWIAELLAVVIAALILGGVSTALDFGGWNELDWRAAAFAFGCAFAAVACVRIVRLSRRSAA